MKCVYVIVCVGMFLGVSTVNAQLLNPKEILKNKTQQRTNQGMGKGADKGLDKVEEGIGNIFKKKEKSPSQGDQDGGGGGTNGESIPAKTISESSSSTEKTSLKSYSKFDFIPGEKVIGFEDFSQDEVGDFPDKWNTNSSGEVVKFDGIEGKWFQMDRKGVYFPEFIKGLPENVTIEFDMLASDELSEMQSGLKIYLVDSKSRDLQFDQYFDKSASVKVDVHPVGSGGYTDVKGIDKNENTIVENEMKLIGWKEGEINRISISKQKTRFRLYVNEVKVWDLPKIIDPSVEYAILFATNLWSGNVYISNLRIAQGQPDTRNKLITEGKFVTRGITFDVNSDKIKNESYGTLKEIATVLQENSGIQVKIVGHTDSDGSEESNLILSKKRAESVKNALVNEFGINASRLQTEGKGESEPTNDNNTPQGKANNRRVEFIKIN